MAYIHDLKRTQIPQHDKNAYWYKWFLNMYTLQINTVKILKIINVSKIFLKVVRIVYSKMNIVL